MPRLSTLGRRVVQRGDRGETLVEVLVAVMILSTAVVALVGGIALAVRVSTIHRSQTTAGAAVRAFAEALETRVAASPTGYVQCALPADYQGIYTAPTGYAATPTAVAYWSGTAFVTGGACPPADLGVQRVSLLVTSDNGYASETLDVVLRKPCRTVDTLCT
jgi:type II secretory pathway pseudopilin PulG